MRIMTAKEKLQEAGKRLWEDERIRENFLNESGKLDTSKTISVVKEMVSTIADMGRDIKCGNYVSEQSWKWFLMIACAAYAISPLDFLPDFIPGIGWSDDVGMLGIAFYFAGDEINKYREWKYENVAPIEKDDFDGVIDTLEFREVVEATDEPPTSSGSSPLDKALGNLSGLYSDADNDNK